MRTEFPSPAGVARFGRPLAVVAVPVLLAPVVLAHPGARGAALLVAATAAFTVVAALSPGRGRRVTPGSAALAAAGLSMLVDLFYPGPYRLPAFWLPFEWLALLGLLFRGVRRLPDRWAGPVGALVGLAAVLLPLRFALRTPQRGLAGPVTVVLVSLLPTLGVAGASLYLRVLDARRERAVDRARREQRLEVARGLHDFVAHEITGIVLEAQAGQLPGQESEETTALLRRLEEAGLRALDSMDEMVGALRDPRSDPGAAGATGRRGLTELPDLVARFGATGGPRSTIDLAPGTADLLTAEAQATAYAVVLEALTNIRRHAPGTTEVAVRVAPGPGRSVEVTVTDTGDPSRGRGPLLRRRPGSGGTGLAGLAARAAAHGGTLAAGPRAPSGWRVVCTLPGR
ncbi:ATP-binding protein [Kitasatospora sp. MAA19]|uniref:sensor histidine kinase n=1 Tax=Kitasatospora sp. MAA19 TaxID=3035090 RepID=UPI0024743A5A|nr:ATP-binding protein [Kitasatospora sp. MAA19]